MTALVFLDTPRPVSIVRRLLAQRQLAVLICVAALVMKLLVPAGYMIADDQGRIGITICDGVAPRTMTMDMAGMDGAQGADGTMPGHGTSRDHGKAEMPCGFAGLSAPLLGAIDPIQLAALIVFILAIGRVGILPPAPFQPTYLRPPLRGPPARP